MKVQHWSLALSLTATLAIAGWAQQKTQPSSTPPPAPAKSSAAPSKPAESSAAVAPEAAVITLDGVCKAKNPTTGKCSTTVTRAQFERLLNALGATRPGRTLPAAEKRRFAAQYARTIVLAAQAEKEGLLSRPEAQELLKFARLQVAEHELLAHMQQTAQPTPRKYKSSTTPTPINFPS